MTGSSAAAEAFLAGLENGEEIEELDGDAMPLALARMQSPKAILRSIKFISPYLPHRITHNDWRYPDAADLWRKWRAYLAEAEGKKQEILSRAENSSAAYRTSQP